MGEPQGPLTVVGTTTTGHDDPLQAQQHDLHEHDVFL
jgi:hypothetical protein